jgi:hypothetical protein
MFHTLAQAGSHGGYPGRLSGKTRIDRSASEEHHSDMVNNLKIKDLKNFVLKHFLSGKKNISEVLEKDDVEFF